MLIKFVNIELMWIILWYFFSTLYIYLYIQIFFAMLMSHNSSDQEVEFFLSFLYNAINGDDRYKEIVISMLQDAKSLASGESIYQVDRSSLSLKILIDRLAHQWLLDNDVTHASNDELKELQKLINDNKNYVIA